MCKPRSLGRMVLRLNKRLNTRLNYGCRDENKSVEWVASLDDFFVVVKVKGIKQKHLPEDRRQRAAVLQLCVANDIILFQVSRIRPYFFSTNCSE
jgi:hypothetical protein